MTNVANIAEAALLWVNSHMAEYSDEAKATVIAAIIQAHAQLEAGPGKTYDALNTAEFDVFLSPGGTDNAIQVNIRRND